ncbi:glucose PTS transporter transcription antiterminator GlcT [Clostridium sp. ZS2-4]|uniref:glucose PTS transporter transcription antiterminator GlcT n=1 Tax=Clostridium sp. ZS2-4 TaxID=2987703 RepID=UPI00227C1958|nr:PRD domain-containing protein [Clostridium sp. ZS2-4]MCY6356524.1 PRD domain-containing protein [Clostridium sp. ZS2-4]
MESYDYKVNKVFNNNVILVSQNDKEKIIIKKGLGFGKKTGDIISGDTSIEKVFVIREEDNFSRFNQLLTNVDEDVVGMCEEIISMISDELKEELNEKIHISLTDHIAYTLKRLEKDDEIINPFLIETETLYKNEFQIAEKAVRIIEKRTGLKVPDGEIGFITLHIHSARNKGNLSNTIKYAFLCNSIVEFIEDSLDIYIDRQSLDYARFLTHIRFAIERILSDNPIKNELLSAIKKQYKQSYKLAKKVAKIIERDLNIEVVEDEIGYICIHIEKLKNAS